MDERVRKAERAHASGEINDAELFRIRERADGFDANSIEIDGELFEVEEIEESDHEGLAHVHADGISFYVATDSETAGRANRARWAEMVETDPSEFRAMVGDDTLVAWALGQSAGPGNVHVRSLNDWLDLCIKHPEEEFAAWDGQERDIDRVGSELVEQLGFTPTVAYRYN